MEARIHIHDICGGFDRQRMTPISAAVRLAAAVDHGGVTIDIADDGAAIWFNDVVLATVAERVSGESVTVTIQERNSAGNLASMPERTITRDPISVSVIVWIRETIERLEARSATGG
jgi:hypothetical protein